MQATHETMETEHAQWESEHARVCKQTAVMRSDHFKAFSLLRTIEADLLRHEAEFTEILEEIRAHNEEINEHNRQIKRRSEYLQSEYIDTALHESMEQRHRDVTAEHAIKLEKLQKLSTCHEKVMKQLKCDSRISPCTAIE